jgi:ATP-binding cassette subfamily B protein
MRELLYLNKYFWRYRWRFFAGILFVIISNIFSLFPARFVRESFDTVTEAIKGFQAGVDQDVNSLKNQLLLYGILLIAMALARGLFMFFMRQTIIVMSRLIEFDLKNEIFQQYQALSLSFYKKNSTGDLMNRISEDVSKVRMYIGPAIMYGINVMSQIIIVVSVMLTVNVKLTFYALLPLPFLSIAIYFVSQEINKRSEKVQEQLSKLSTWVQEAISGIRVIKSFSREEQSAQGFEQECIVYKDKNLGLVKINALFFPLMVLLIGTSTILTIFIGGQLAIEGKITTGNIAEFLIYVGMLTWPVAALGWVTSIIQQAAASQKRINEFLKMEPEIVNLEEEVRPIEGMIEFQNVHFTYPDSGIYALKGIDFKLERGKSLAIVGRTGSGKSTIANLIGRLYECQEGEIFIDDQPIRYMHLGELRRSIGYVPQEGFLFSESIYENIRFGMDEVSEEEVIQAAKDSDVHKNIMEFPQKYDTKVGERGVTLSGGQKQRVSIARAIIKKPSILIFDDCLSAVDTQTEELILSNLKRIMKDRSTIIISHRVSSVKYCDEIIVLDDGAIIERGDHKKLIDKDGYYADLYRRQLIEEERAA